METEMEMDGMVVAGAIMGCGGNESESDREQPPGLQDETRRDAGLGLWTACALRPCLPVDRLLRRKYTVGVAQPLRENDAGMTSRVVSRGNTASPRGFAD
uniref:Uncharacterized protein n=2 Tax=Oryza sativa subsp. japonica TaxID=39947 RepID=Q6ATR1_ORYSJ|nr:hypothetical protein [Oryza sativa Japonica Group]ABF99482.1 hypothetical protein LOC_Os03g59560 [Oryza sativa Japonica Group]